MEIKPLGTFNMSVGRPTDTIRFERINGKQIVYQEIDPSSSAMPVQSIVKINKDPHPDYFKALDALSPFAIEVIGYDKQIWSTASIGALVLEWSYNDNIKRYIYKIDKITIARPSEVNEVITSRTMNIGGITIDNIPHEVQGMIEEIMDEAWLYCTGRKTAQLNLFDVEEKPEASPIVQTSQTVETRQDEQEEETIAPVVVTQNRTRSKKAA